MIFNVKIQNFKSIKIADVELPRFGAMIGQNASGKSNFIAALELTKLLSRGTELNKVIKEFVSFPTELFYKPKENQEIFIELQVGTLTGRIFKYSYVIRIGSTNSPQRSLTIDRELLEEIIDGKSQLVYRRNKDIVSAPKDGKEIDVPLKTDPNKLVLGSYSEDSVVSVANAISGYSIVKNGHYDKDRELVVTETITPQNIDELAVFLSNKDSSIFASAMSVIQSIIADFVPPEIVPIKKPDAEQANSNDTSNEATKSQYYLVEWKEKSITESLTLPALSMGNLKTISIILNLFNSPKGSLMVVEEIENGMHPDRISRLIDQVRTQAANRVVQILFTTHNTEILDTLIPEEVIYCSKPNNQGSIYKILSKSEDYALIRSEIGSKKITALDIYKTGFVK